MSLLRWIRTLFVWREVRRDNHWAYSENAVTGERRVVRHNFTPGWPAAPPDMGWVNNGWDFGEERRRMPPPPPASDD